MECNVGAAWVELDNSETYWFAASWADVFDCKIHVLFLRPTLFGASATDTRMGPGLYVELKARTACVGVPIETTVRRYWLTFG